MKRSVFVAILLLVVGAGPAYCLQIVYPRDMTSVTRSDYLIAMAGGEPKVDGLVIEINGVASDLLDISGADYRKIYGDKLIVQPDFDPGKNLVKVFGYHKGKKVATVEARIFYADTPERVPPGGYAPYLFHLPEQEALCVPCHNLAPTEQQLNSSNPKTHPCAPCHKRLLDKKHVHGPAGVYECTYCHQADSRPSRYQPRPGDAALCKECHEDKTRQFLSAKFVHGPIEAGMCLVCHDPHASDHRAQLVSKPYLLCLGCHEKVGKEPHVSRGATSGSHPLMGVPDPANKGNELSCASCHDPHSGAVKSMLRWGLSSRYTLCGKCHQK